MTDERVDEVEDCGCSEYNALSRRQFLGGAAMAGATAFFPAWLPKVVLAETYASTRDIIVSVFLRGGADGLSLCVPFGDADYYTGRSTIAIPRPDSSAATKGIALDGFFAFPQAMSPLVPAFTAMIRRMRFSPRTSCRRWIGCSVTCLPFGRSYPRRFPVCCRQRPSRHRTCRAGLRDLRGLRRTF